MTLSAFFIYFFVVMCVGDTLCVCLLMLHLVDSRQGVLTTCIFYNFNFLVFFEISKHEINQMHPSIIFVLVSSNITVQCAK